MARIFPGLLILILLQAACRAAIPDAAHPDYALAEIRMPSLYKTMGLAFLKDGTMVLATADLIGAGEVPEANARSKVYLVKWASADSLPSQMREVSNTWKQLSGVTVMDDRVFVADRDGFYEIPNLGSPPDPAANRRLVVKWPDEGHWNISPYWHQWAFTPMFLNGSFFAPYSGSIFSGGWSNADPTSRLSGAFLKWDLAGHLEAYAGGLRSPNGANYNPATGEMFVTDNQGSWLPSSTFMRIRKDRFYGHRQSSPDLDTAGNIVNVHAPNFAEGLPYEPPVAWLPHGAVRSSPSQPILLRKGTFAGDWLIGDVNGEGLVRVGLDRVGDAYNGAVFWFSKGTGASAINRLAEDPNGGIVIGTLTKVGGNWPAGEESPLYRLSAKPPSEPKAFDLKAVRSLDDGLELEFTLPILADSLSPQRFAVTSAQYIRQREYGQGKQPDEIRSVTAVQASVDGRRVHLVVPGLPADRVVWVKVSGLPASGGKILWNDQAWFTLNTLSPRKWDGNAAGSRLSSPALAPALGLASLTVTDGEVGFSAACGMAAGGCGEGAGFTARLLSLQGRVLAAASASGSERIRFSRPGAGPGVYLLQVRSAPGDGSGSTLTRRLVF